MTILFPCEQNLKQVDENFLLEFNMCKKLQINIALYDHDKFITDDYLKITNFSDDKIILRSWMLNKSQYLKLYNKLLIKNCKLINNIDEYLYCHYFPNVLQDIKNYCINSTWFYLSDMDDKLLKLVHKNIKTDLIIKDFVKSEKGTNFFKINKDITFNDFKIFVNGFINERQPLFNEGIVLKEYMKVKNNEWRAFILNGELISLDCNSINNCLESPSIDYIKTMAKIINKSNFYTIDFIQKENNDWIILESGDGQVSGLPKDTNVEKFYINLQNYINK
ncbi:ATP-grasp domain-containing protein [Candidatus Dojkabacteria bacterium]|jgi:hypothetical protein|nr:ATP-grasp domain-containing protein [Candidatus Dojkabacteria bacterium]